MSFKLAPEGFNMRDVDIWGVLYEAKELGTPVQAIITRVRQIDGQGETWELEFPNSPGATGLVPAAENGLPDKCPMNAFVGKKIMVKVKGIDKSKSIVACSRKEVVENSMAKLIGQLENGEVINSMVRLVTEYNLYLDLGGGVIVKIYRDKARLSDGVPLDIQYREGDVVKVQVTKINFENKEIAVEPVDPWEVWSFNRGEVAFGKIIAVRDMHIYAMVKPGLVGLVSFKPYEYFEEGEQLELQVVSFDRAKRKLHLKRWDPKRAVERKRERARARTLRLAAKQDNKGKEVKNNVVTGVFEGQSGQG